MDPYLGDTLQCASSKFEISIFFTLLLAESIISIEAVSIELEYEGPL